MSGRTIRILAVLVPAAITLAVVVIAILLYTAGRREASFELTPVNPGGPVGVARLAQDSGRLRGTIVVWGLGPSSRHLVLLRGPGARCSSRPGQAAGRALALPQLVADPNGVGFLRLDQRAEERVVERGFLALVYSGLAPPARNARVACGDLFGGRPIGPAAIASVGPGAAARAQASTILQLRDGRPIGGPQRIAARRGERVALAIRSDLPDEVTIAGLGLTQQVGPGTIARFSFPATRTGRFAVRARTGGNRPVATLEVGA